jgi:hypothetical protein
VLNSFIQKAFTKKNASKLSSSEDSAGSSDEHITLNISGDVAGTFELVLLNVSGTSDSSTRSSSPNTGTWDAGEDEAKVRQVPISSLLFSQSNEMVDTTSEASYPQSDASIVMNLGTFQEIVSKKRFPNPSLSSLRKKKVSPCYLCGRLGHMSRHCPQELCFNCRFPGHRSSVR